MIGMHDSVGYNIIIVRGIRVIQSQEDVRPQAGRWSRGRWSSRCCWRLEAVHHIDPCEAGSELV